MRQALSSPSLDEIRKRSQLLVIDDHAFAYESLFKRDEYHITRWATVKNLSQLTDHHFDLILLDLHGVALKESPDQQGLGLLKHIKDASPAQLVVAYTAVAWSASFHEFFGLADAVLEKGDEYVTFKATVDRLLQRKYSEGYFISRMNATLGDDAANAPLAVKKALRSIRSGNTASLSRYLRSRVKDEVTVDRALAVIGIAISVLA